MNNLLSCDRSGMHACMCFIANQVDTGSIGGWRASSRSRIRIRIPDFDMYIELTSSHLDPEKLLDLNLQFICYMLQLSDGLVIARRSPSF